MQLRQRLLPHPTPPHTRAHTRSAFCPTQPLQQPGHCSHSAGLRAAAPRSHSRRACSSGTRMTSLSVPCASRAALN